MKNGSNNIIKRSLHNNLDVEIIRIKNATTPFGVQYQMGTMILNDDTNGLYQALEVIKPYDTLTSLNTRAVINTIVTLPGITSPIGDNQVLVGTGSGFEGTTKFTYDDTDDAEVLKITGRIEQYGIGKAVIIGIDAGKVDDLTEKDNVFIGDEAGKANTTGDNNNFIGQRAGLKNITGRFNVFQGNGSGQDNTIGERNSFFGNFSGYRNTEGNYNTNIGYNAGYENLVGESNTNLGYNALVFALGDNNLSSGALAGTYLIDGATPLTIANNCLYVGAYTTAKLDSVSNEIVIGANAKGQGSNTATIGDDNITDVYCGEDGEANIHAGNISNDGYKEQTTENAITEFTAVKSFDYVVHREITHSDANWYELFLDGASTQLLIGEMKSWTFDISINGSESGDSNYFAYKIIGCLTRDGSNTVLQGSTVTTIAESSATFDARVTADNVTGALKIEVSDSGSSGETVNWGARVSIIETYSENP